jgi:sugar lactone lactonase YvrE
MRWPLMTAIGVLVLGATIAPRSSHGAVPAFAQPVLAKAKCHYVTKKVNGKKKRVKVCARPKPTPTPVPAPSHLIDASGYVWVDGSGNVYVSSGYLPSNANGWVSKLSPAGKRLATFRSVTSLDGAAGVAVDAAGNVYVSDLGSDRIVKFASNGKELASIGSPQPGPGELSAPSGIGLDTAWHLFVADSNNSRLQEFTAGGQYVAAIGSYGPDPGQLERPLDVAVDGHGNLFVADSENSRVEEFSPSGGFVTAWGTEGNGAGQLEHPKGICLDGAGNVYVADTGNRRIQKFAADGTLLAQWSTGNYEPVSPGVDTAGTVFVTEDVAGGAAGYGLARYSPEGQLLSVWQ